MPRSSMLFFVLVLMGTAFLLYADIADRPPYAAGVPDYDTAIAYWQTKIEDAPVQRTYKRFVKSAEHVGAEDQHLLAHAFGEAAYRAMGPAGISLCGDDFFYGCFHQVAGLSVTTSGIDVLPELRDACGTGSDAEPCNHGVGHGLLAHFGYDENALTGALEQCERIQRNTQFIACSEGVFMEYNRRLLADVLGTGRPLDEGLYNPCQLFNGDRALLCAFWLPNWWYFAEEISSFDDETLRRFGAQCAALEHDMQRACESGIGFMTPITSGYDRAGAVQLCNLLESTHSAHACARGIAKRLDGQFWVPLQRAF